jgi:transcriptional regulator with XRE-family HTH domain
MIEKQLSSSQCRMARAALDWTALQVAEQAGVGVTTVVRFERGQTAPNRATLAALQRALETAGVEFIPENGGGAGVRLRKSEGAA